MKVIIVGGGKIGYYLAKTLIENGHEPSVIEADKRVCNIFANELDIPIIKGDGTTIEVLEDADVKHADAIVAVTGKDEDNLISCQLAKKLFGVKKTVAKVNNPKNEKALQQLGIDIVVSATSNITSILEREIDSNNLKQFIDIKGCHACLYEIVLDEHFSFNNELIKDIHLPDDCNIITITRDNNTLIPRGKTKLKKGDILLILTIESAWSDIKKALKIK